MTRGTAARQPEDTTRAPMSLTDVFVLLGAGITAGLMNAVAGGGTLVTFPSLLLAGLSSIDANATSTVALLPGTAASLAGYRRNIPVVSRWLRLFSPVSLAGGFLGGVLLVQTPTSVFDRLVPFLILFATILFMARASFSKFIRPAEPAPAAGSERAWIRGALIFQFGVGLYGGYFGAGIGILMLASLGMLGFRDVHEMNTVKAVLGFLINVVAAAYFIWMGLIHWGAAAVVTAGAIIGGYGGAHFAQRISQNNVRALITGIGLAISAAMFYRQFWGSAP